MGRRTPPTVWAEGRRLAPSAIDQARVTFFDRPEGVGGGDRELPLGVGEDTIAGCPRLRSGFILTMSFLAPGKLTEDQ